MRKAIKIFIGLLMVAVFVWTIITIKNMPSLSTWFSPEKVVIENSPVVIRQIQALAQLITVSMYDEIVADTSMPDIQHFQLPLLPDISYYRNLNRLVVISKVTVHVGIDLQQLNAGDINGTKDSLHLLLPPAEVLDAIINPSDVEVFIEEGVWNSQAVANLKNKIQNLAVVNAQSRGLMAQSQNKARQILSDFFMAAGYKKVVIDFKSKPASLE